MERHELSADQAFQLLAQVSTRENRKVRDIAEHLVLTGELPGPPPRRTGRRSMAQPPRGRPGGRGREHS